MATLFVLGNGFDLQHGLPTKYDPHLKDLVIGAERFHGEWESYGIEGDSWSRVEESLAELNVDDALEHLESWPPDLASDRERDRDAIIHEAEQLLAFPLVLFAETADARLADTQPQRKFRNLFGADDFFLTFNYTHTLERLYGVDPSRVLHLHGEVGVSPLILGYTPGSLRETGALRQWDDEENFEFYRSRAMARSLIGFPRSRRPTSSIRCLPTQIGFRPTWSGCSSTGIPSAGWTDRISSIWRGCLALRVGVCALIVSGP